MKFGLLLSFSLGALSIISTNSASVPNAGTLSMDRPSAFEEDRGQFGPKGDFVLAGDGFVFRAGPAPMIALVRRIDQNGAAYERGQSARREVTRIPMHFPGSTAASAPNGLEPISERRNYIVGDDREHWQTGVPSYRRVQYPDFYPGVDLEFRVTDGLPEYVFRIAPGADPESVAMAFGNGANLKLKDDGALHVQAGAVGFEQRAPQAWQVIDGERHGVSVGYRIRGNSVAFELGAHYMSETLVIDLVLDFSTFFVGTGEEFAGGAHVDAGGNIYVVGQTQSAGLATAGAFGESNPVARQEIVSQLFCEDCTDGDFFVERVTLDASANALVVSKRMRRAAKAWTRRGSTILESSKPSMFP